MRYAKSNSCSDGRTDTVFILIVANAWPSAQKAMAAGAEKGKVTITVLAENEKVLVQEVTLKVGDVNARRSCVEGRDSHADFRRRNDRQAGVEKGTGEDSAARPKIYCEEHRVL
jgi:hypothetical protein